MTAESSKPGKSVLRYASGERIEVGDVVAEPVNDSEEYGVVKEVVQPGTAHWASAEYPEGVIMVEWRNYGEAWMGNDIILGEDYIYFIRRK